MAYNERHFLHHAGRLGRLYRHLFLLHLQVVLRVLVFSSTLLNLENSRGRLL